MIVLRELLATLADTLTTGDLAGHLRAWWQVVTNRTMLPIEQKDNSPRRGIPTRA